MTTRRRHKLDVKNLKFVPISEVPEVVRKTIWGDVFKKIPMGQALILTEAEASPETVRSALRRYQKDGKFTHLEGTTRKVNDKRVVYILNPVPKPEPATLIKGFQHPVPPEHLPSEEEVFRYITSKPTFSHTLGEIQEQFFGKRLPRSDPKMRTLYLRLRGLVLGVRGRIEKEYGGKFESIMMGREKRFTFKEDKKEDIATFG